MLKSVLIAVVVAIVAVAGPADARHRRGTTHAKHTTAPTKAKKPDTASPTPSSTGKVDPQKNY